MNLSTLHRPFELAAPWSAISRRTRTPAAAAPPSRVSELTDLQRRLVMLHVAQATPTRPADERPSWPGVAIVCSLIVAALAIGTGAWE